MSNKFFGDIKANSTDVSITVVMRNSNTGKVETGIVFGDIDICYYRQGASDRIVVPAVALGSLDAAHSDGGWYEICNTHQPGVYRLDLPDAAVLEGCDWVNVGVSHAATYSEYVNIKISDPLNDIIDSSATHDYTHAEVLKLLLSLIGGITTDTNTLNPKVRNLLDTLDAISVTLDADGNREAVELDIT